MVNGRHLSFGSDPQRQMWVAGQLFNLNTYNAVPSGIRVHVEYGHDTAYGHVVPAEIRELVTHVPVWNGVATGPVTGVRDRPAERRPVLRSRAARPPAAGSDLPLPFRVRQGRRARLHARRELHHRPSRAQPRAVHVHRLRRPGHHRGSRHRPDDRQRRLPPAGVLVAHHRRLLRPLRPGLLRPDIDDRADRYLAGRGAGHARSRGSAIPSTAAARGSTCWPATSATRTPAATRSRSSTPMDTAARSRAPRTRPRRRRTAAAGTTSIPTCGPAISAPSSAARPPRRGCSPPATTTSSCSAPRWTPMRPRSAITAPSATAATPSGWTCPRTARASARRSTASPTATWRSLASTRTI